MTDRAQRAVGEEGSVPLEVSQLVRGSDLGKECEHLEESELRRPFACYSGLHNEIAGDDD